MRTEIFTGFPAVKPTPGRKDSKSARAPVEDDQDNFSHQCNYQSFFLNAVEGMFQSTADGKYLEVNPALARMYGYASVEELMGSVGDISQQIYVDPSIRDQFKKAIERQGYVAGMEYQVRRKDGRTIWICEHARAVRNSRNKLLYYEGTIQDITLRKEAELAKERLENQLRQAQKMEAIGTLAGGIAHDFNNILGAMLGFTELSIAEVPPQSKTHGYLQEVLKANQRARGLVKQILACSRQMASERITLRLGHMAKEVLRLMNASLPNNIRCRSEIKTEQDWVLADPTQIHQILVNLCINAAYAMRARGGELVIRVSPFFVNENGSPVVLPPGNYVCLEVSDTGVGIPPEIVTRIFEPFFTTKPQGEGTGLGLSVAHGIVTSHQGAITVESQVGKGTLFRVFLPKANQPAEAQAQEDQKPVKGHGRILLVDDEDALVKMMQPRLRELGYRVTTRLDSLDAWRTFQAAPQSYDVIITDLNMPQMSGVEFLQHARNVRSDIPVILFSGQIIDLDKLLGMGFNAVLAKPINMASFSRTLRDCCAKVKTTGK